MWVSGWHVLLHCHCPHAGLNQRSSMTNSPVQRGFVPIWSFAFPPSSNIWFELLEDNCLITLTSLTSMITCWAPLLPFTCVLIPDWGWAAGVHCICRTSTWKPAFLRWSRPRTHCLDSLPSYGPSAEEGRRRRCRRSQRRSPAGQEVRQIRHPAALLNEG